MIALAQKLGLEIDRLPPTANKQRLKSISNQISRYVRVTRGSKPPPESNESIKQRKSQAWGMEKLMEYFRKSAKKFGNPKVIEIEKPVAFDLRWGSQPPLTLRWTWSDPYGVRTELEEGSLLGIAISSAHHEAHVELADPASVWLYVSKRFKNYSGKVEKTTIARCLTKQGEWMKKALRAGKKFLTDLA
ncbi:MAG: hypothetical protein JO232_13955 [Verrucomicrobia bacterium]|nr:hypothetical protein [Verrucomicrobiota bacterium]